MSHAFANTRLSHSQKTLFKGRFEVHVIIWLKQHSSLHQQRFDRIVGTKSVLVMGALGALEMPMLTWRAVFYSAMPLSNARGRCKCDWPTPQRNIRVARPKDAHRGESLVPPWESRNLNLHVGTCFMHLYASSRLSFCFLRVAKSGFSNCCWWFFNTCNTSMRDCDLISQYSVKSGLKGHDCAVPEVSGINETPWNNHMWYVFDLIYVRFGLSKVLFWNWNLWHNKAHPSSFRHFAMFDASPATLGKTCHVLRWTAKGRCECHITSHLCSSYKMSSAAHLCWPVRSDSSSARSRHFMTMMTMMKMSTMSTLRKDEKTDSDGTQLEPILQQCQDFCELEGQCNQHGTVWYQLIWRDLTCLKLHGRLM